MTKMLEQHLLGRSLDTTKYVNAVLHQPYENSLTGSIYTVMLTDYSGKFTGYQQYRPDILDKSVNDPKMARYFTYLPRSTVGMWGLEVFDKSKKDIYFVEGTFKASALHNLGLNAIAVLGSRVDTHKKDLERLNLLGYNLIAIGDNDKAGEGLVKLVDRANKNPVGFTSEKDLDEMSHDEIRDLILLRKEDDSVKQDYQLLRDFF